MYVLTSYDTKGMTLSTAE